MIIRILLQDRSMGRHYSCIGTGVEMSAISNKLVEFFKEF